MSKHLETIKEFYTKANPWEKYDEEMRGRIEFTIQHFQLNMHKFPRIADFGGGYSLFLRLLPERYYKFVFDGAKVDTYYLRKHNIEFNKCDLNNLDFEKHIDDYALSELFRGYFNISCAFEVCEHIPNLYSFIYHMKEMTTLGGEIYLNITHEKTQHNTLYPGLFYPESNFETFLEQMALPILDKVYCDKSFHSWIYKCENQPWNNKKLMFPKNDEKYRNVDPLTVVNS